MHCAQLKVHGDDKYKVDFFYYEIGTQSMRAKVTAQIAVERIG